MVELDPCVVIPASGRENVVRAVLTIQGLKFNLLFKDAIWRTCSAEIKILFAIFILINVEVPIYFQRLRFFGQFRQWSRKKWQKTAITKKTLTYFVSLFCINKI